MVEFFDKMKQGFNKGVMTVSVKSKEMLETTKIKGEIDSSKQKRRELLEELGNIVYTMIMRDNFDLSRLEQKAEFIKDLDQQIAKKEEELESIKILTMEALGQAQVVGLCECGAPISKEVKFCGKCGKKVLE